MAWRFKLVWLLWLLPIIALSVGLVLPASIIILHTCQGNRARDEISEAFRETYPAIQFRAGMSYTNPTVTVVVFGVNDREEQREIARWLGELKTARRIGPEIRLTFGEIDLWDDADVIWIR